MRTSNMAMCYIAQRLRFKYILRIINKFTWTNNFLKKHVKIVSILAPLLHFISEILENYDIVIMSQLQNSNDGKS